MSLSSSNDLAIFSILSCNLMMVAISRLFNFVRMVFGVVGRESRPGYLPNRYILFVNPANEAMGVNVVQIFVGCKYCRITGTNQLTIRVVDVIANVFNEIHCFRAVGGFNCCHNSCLILWGGCPPPGPFIR